VKSQKTWPFWKQNIGIHQNQHNRRIPERRAREDLEVDRNIVFKTLEKQWACSNQSFDRKKMKEVTRLLSSGNDAVSPGRCTRRFTGIVGLIPKLLQLQAQVTLKNPSLCHKWGKCTKSFARACAFLQLKRWRYQYSSAYVADAIM